VAILDLVQTEVEQMDTETNFVKSKQRIQI